MNLHYEVFGNDGIDNLALMLRVFNLVKMVLDWGPYLLKGLSVDLGWPYQSLILLQLRADHWIMNLVLVKLLILLQTWSEEPVQVTGDPNAEFDWKCEALQSVAKRAKLFGDKLPWEHSAFRGIFGKTDIFAGTFAAGYKYSLAPTSIGAVEVLQSEVITARKTETPSSSTSPPVSSLVLIREAADEDIRRMALSKLWDLILGDPAATNLGISLKSMLEAGSVSYLIEQSFSDCFCSKASTTLQKRANSLWRLSKLLASRGMLTPLRLTEEDLYMALCSLRESKAGATSGQHIIEALHFLDGTAGLSLVDVKSFLSFLADVVGWLVTCFWGWIHCSRNIHSGLNRWPGLRNSSNTLPLCMVV